MKIAIVGTSKLTPEEEIRARDAIIKIISKETHPIIITGDADGIDKVVRELSYTYHTLRIYEASTKGWEGPNGFKARNIRMAENCDEIYSISTKIKDEPCYHHDGESTHQRTGGCYTLKHALKLGKRGEVIVI